MNTIHYLQKSASKQRSARYEGHTSPTPPTSPPCFRCECERPAIPAARSLPRGRSHRCPSCDSQRPQEWGGGTNTNDAQVTNESHPSRRLQQHNIFWAEKRGAGGGGEAMWHERVEPCCNFNFVHTYGNLYTLNVCLVWFLERRLLQ